MPKCAASSPPRLCRRIERHATSRSNEKLPPPAPAPTVLQIEPYGERSACPDDFADALARTPFPPRKRPSEFSTVVSRRLNDPLVAPAARRTGIGDPLMEEARLDGAPLAHCPRVDAPGAAPKDRPTQSP